MNRSAKELLDRCVRRGLSESPIIDTGTTAPGKFAYAEKDEAGNGVLWFTDVQLVNPVNVFRAGSVEAAALTKVIETHGRNVPYEALVDFPGIGNDVRAELEHALTMTSRSGFRSSADCGHVHAKDVLAEAPYAIISRNEPGPQLEYLGYVSKNYTLKSNYGTKIDYVVSVPRDMLDHFSRAMTRLAMQCAESRTSDHCAANLIESPFVFNQQYVSYSHRDAQKPLAEVHDRPDGTVSVSFGYASPLIRDKQLHFAKDSDEAKKLSLLMREHGKWISYDLLSDIPAIKRLIDIETEHTLPVDVKSYRDPEAIDLRSVSLEDFVEYTPYAFVYHREPRAGASHFGYTRFYVKLKDPLFDEEDGANPLFCQDYAVDVPTERIGEFRRAVSRLLLTRDK